MGLLACQPSGSDNLCVRSASLFTTNCLKCRGTLLGLWISTAEMTRFDYFQRRTNDSIPVSAAFIPVGRLQAVVSSGDAALPACSFGVSLRRFQSGNFPVMKLRLES